MPDTVTAAPDTSTADSTPDTSASVDSTPNVDASSTDEPRFEEGSLEAEMVSATEKAGLSLDDTVSPAPKPEPVVEAPKPEDDTIEALAREAKDKGKNNKIPYNRVRTIVQNAEKRVAAEYETKLQEHTAKVSQYEQQLQQVAKVEQLMQSDPAEFISRLKQIPGYAALLGADASQRGEDTTTDTPQRARDASYASSEPGPDLQYSDGSTGYSPQQQAAYTAWHVQQALDRQAKQFEQRFGPIERDYKTKAIIHQAIPKVQAQIAEAKTWPMFEENIDAIQQVLAANPDVSLDAAYRHVVYPKLKADRNTLYEEVLAQVNGKPRSTSTSPSSGSATSQELTTEEKMIQATRAAGLKI